MFSRTAIGTLVTVVAVTLILGGIAPPPAQANDTGRILAGIAAGAIVYGLLGDDDRGRDRDHRYYSGRNYGDRGFYSGNSRSWDYRPSPRHRGHDYGSQQYRRGYHRGFDDGRRVGYRQGWDNGYDYGYERGYDHGFDDGYDRGRRSDWGCWGGWAR